MTAGSPFLSLIVPMYNESENLDAFFTQITPILETLKRPYEIVCIDDGSTDDTLLQLKKISERRPSVKVLVFARNFGKEAAMTAGLDYATGQVIIPIDADLQDPPELIPQMIEQWEAGYKVVLATRQFREGETWLKRLTADWFYRLINRISRITIPHNTGDYRLLDRQVADVIRAMPERNRFMKGIYAWPGFKTTQIFFHRKPRHAGKSSWSFWKLWQFALDGIFAFSTAPLKVWTYVGVSISLVSFIYALFLIGRTLFVGADVPGYASLMTVVLFLGGIQLISLGVIGEYIGRIYRETKQRPIYILSETIGHSETSSMANHSKKK